MESNKTMKPIAKIHGHDAIRLAERDGLTLHKYADPESGYERGISPDKAREIAKQDPGLVYVVVTQTGWHGGNGEGYNVLDYFPGSLQGHALSGARYLGPDEDGVEPTWEDTKG